jgi:methylated-DNA-protein-cysteine methyltransferase-like protein
LIFQLVGKFHALAEEVADLFIGGVGMLVANAGEGDAAGKFVEARGSEEFALGGSVTGAKNLVAVEGVDGFGGWLHTKSITYQWTEKISEVFVREKSKFRERIYRVVAKIPRGKVVSYGMVALLAGRMGAGRAVGRAMREVPRGRKLPCHRVIKWDGALSPEHVFGGRQRRMLEREGVVFKKDGRVEMNTCEWEG